MILCPLPLPHVFTIRPLRIMSVILLFLLLAPAPAAVAQIQGESAASAKDVFMAFFKAGDTSPDFEKMAEGHPDYPLVPRARQDSFLREEKTRLIAEWRAYNPEEDLLLVRVPIFTEIARMQDDAGNDSYTLTLTLEQGDNVFFPYEYLDYKIAVLPQKIDELLYHQIPKSQYDLILNAMEGKKRGIAHMWFRLKPVKSYMNQPYDIGGVDQWVLLANIAGLSLVTKNGENLWNYAAQWYVSPVKDDLLDIYDDEKAKKTHEMTTQNPVLPDYDPIPSH